MFQIHKTACGDFVLSPSLTSCKVRTFYEVLADIGYHFGACASFF